MDYHCLQVKNVKFIMTQQPNTSNMVEFENMLEKCDVNYIIHINKNIPIISNPDIIIKNLYFKDGDYPPDHIIKEFNQFMIECKQKFEKPVVVIYCIAGLGRSPCLIALEMINTRLFKDRFLLVEYIRGIKRGCFNQRQLRWVLDYKPDKSEKPKKQCCFIL